MTFLLSGCNKQIFVDENDEYTLKELTEKELEKDNYYVKDKTKFYSVYMPDGTANGIAKSQSDNRLLWTSKDESLVPTYYKGEIIAYPSEDVSLTDITIERFKDIGYSMGIYGATYTSEGYISFSAKGNTIKGSDAETVFSSATSDNIRLATINDKTVTEENLNSAGMLVGLEQDGKYELGLYAGTYYTTVTVSADLHFYQSYEIYQIDKADDTKNGYLAISLPDDLKSGYYTINGKGMFKYVAYEKGNESTDIDYNEAYYSSKTEQISAYAQSYVVSVPTSTKNVAFTITYEESGNDEDIYACLIAPDKTTYDLTASEGMMYIELEQVPSGRWSIYVVPKDLNVLDIKAEALEKKEDGTKETYTLTVEEDRNIKVEIPYEGEGEVWGTITYEDGTAVTLSVDEKNKKLYAVYDYMASGTYEVAVYHYADTSIGEPTYETNESDLTKDIITIEG